MTVTAIDIIDLGDGLLEVTFDQPISSCDDGTPWTINANPIGVFSQTGANTCYIGIGASIPMTGTVDFTGGGISFVGGGVLAPFSLAYPYP